ncbi:uncharacterized protein FIESC28_09040 [Fusarium coffeatum]|uniref:Apple domain-containing protein n=1 Tax=Fusarium coffeatum TaxID=231269 RepID=A0A366R509_9HYPO|nr:uncharacterized protein FIESC28_09040 [Fusarium coffeatum]RBR11426.1 hypothetical protein FIESC28_09040 [Fusarium coffeatum]
MPSVNTFITALVAGLAIGAQAGPCRPHPPSSSIVQSQVTTTAYAQSSTETSAAYSDVVRKSETEASISTTAVEVTSSEKAETTPITTDEEATTTGSPATESTSIASDSLTTETTIESSQETTSSVPTTTQEPGTTLHTTTSVPSTSSDAEAAPTTTSSEPTTTSASAISGCPARSSLTCGLTGQLSTSSDNLIDMLGGLDLEECKAACSDDEDCKAMGITGAGQCELYDDSISALGFEAEDNWFSVYDACCFEEEGQ